jgi:hypothetical protein
MLSPTVHLSVLDGNVCSDNVLPLLPQLLLLPQLHRASSCALFGRCNLRSHGNDETLALLPQLFLLGSLPVGLGILWWYRGCHNLLLPAQLLIGVLRLRLRLFWRWLRLVARVPKAPGGKGCRSACTCGTDRVMSVSWISQPSDSLTCHLAARIAASRTSRCRRRAQYEARCDQSRLRCHAWHVGSSLRSHLQRGNLRRLSASKRQKRSLSNL